MKNNRRIRVLVAKTGLDGHWRGVSVVATGLRDAGFEVVMGGMSRPEEIVALATQEDIDLIGLNVGGRIEVVERAISAIREALPSVPIIAGGALPPPAIRRLTELGVAAFPPGSTIAAIVAEVVRQTADIGRA